MNNLIFFTHKKNDLDYFFDKNSLKFLDKNIKILFNPKNRHLSEKEVIKYSKNASIIITEWWTGAGTKLLQSKNLKAIIRCGVEIKNIDFDIAKKNNVAIINVPNTYSNSVAELVITLILSLSRNLIHFHNKTVSGFYSEAIIEMMSNGKVKFKNWPQFEISGKTLGLIGFGSIGKLVYEKASNLGMKVLIHDPFISKKTKKIKLVSLNYLLKNSDFVSLHANYNNNKYMISYDEFKLMKKDSFLINTARGNLINTNAMFKILKTNKIAGAAIDVLETDKKFERKKINKWKHSENFANTKLNKLNNIILTPHMAGITRETIIRQSYDVIKIINLIFKNKLPKSVVNNVKKIKIN